MSRVSHREKLNHKTTQNSPKGACTNERTLKTVLGSWMCFHHAGLVGGPHIGLTLNLFWISLRFHVESVWIDFGSDGSLISKNIRNGAGFSIHRC